MIVMNKSELEQRLEVIHCLLEKKREAMWFTQREWTLARALKISEELWELHNEILALYNGQREEKLLASSVSLQNEIADVCITTFLLAKDLDINIFDAMDEKLNLIEERGGI